MQAKSVSEEGAARQKQTNKRSLCVISEYCEFVFNTAATTQVAFSTWLLNDKQRLIKLNRLTVLG